MPTSVRLDPETEMLLTRLARRSGRSKSEVLREALRRFADESDRPAEGGGPFALVSDLVGVATGGSASLARDHKRAYRDSLAQKRRR